MEKIAVVAAIPSARAATAVTVKPGLFRNMRIECLMSLIKSFIASLPIQPNYLAGSWRFGCDAPSAAICSFARLVQGGNFLDNRGHPRIASALSCCLRIPHLAAAISSRDSPRWEPVRCFQPSNPELRLAAGSRVIDCHHHFVSPAFLKALTAKEGHKVDGFTSFFPLGLWKDYSPAKDIESMDRDGVATSLISCTAPGVWFGDPDEARGLARELNEYGAKMACDYKGRYGLLAVLPIPSVDESLKEIEYAFDTLKADGVGILTSYGKALAGRSGFSTDIR